MNQSKGPVSNNNERKGQAHMHLVVLFSDDGRKSQHHMALACRGGTRKKQTPLFLIDSGGGGMRNHIVLFCTYGYGLRSHMVL